MSNCGCGSQHAPVVSICDPCNTNSGCAIQLDWDCSIYHKSNNQVTKLDCLGLTNGATLTQFAEAVDAYICQLKVANYVLPCLREDYTINSLQQFAEAVDTEICDIKENILSITGLINTPITAIDTSTINLSATGTLNHTIQADVMVSGNANNQLTVLPSGLYSSPQNLSVNYGTGEISISDGNTVDLTPMLSNPQGYLGSVSVDPSSPINGQYWFRTDLAIANALRIRVNGVTRTIPTT